MSRLPTASKPLFGAACWRQWLHLAPSESQQQGTVLCTGIKRTRHPARVAAGIPRGNCAGTLAESASYGQQARKIRRLQVYARKHVENKAAKGEMGGSRLLRG